MSSTIIQKSWTGQHVSLGQNGLPAAADGTKVFGKLDHWLLAWQSES